MDECEAPKRKQGRQTKYTPAKAKEILRRLAGGETLTSICRDMQIPPSTVYQWTVDRGAVMDECEAPKRKQGRQTKYTPAKAKEILRRLAGGETLTSICRDMQIPPSTVYQWTVDRNDFAVDFARARDLFQLLLKGCTIEAMSTTFLPISRLSFSCC